MNFLTKVAAAAVLLTTVNVFAGSRFLDRDPLRTCGGHVELSEAANGDLALKFENLNTNNCDTLRFYDVTSGRTLQTYDIRGTSYTLSKSQRSALSSDCRVGFTVSGYRGNDDFNVTLGWWCEVFGGGQTGGHNGGSNQSFQLSGAGNCKLLINGVYANRNVSDVFCGPARNRSDVVSYEFSRNNNCKVMINGSYANQNVSDYFCTSRQ